MLIAIEGIDGSGKGVQTGLLARRSAEAGLRVTTFSFPRYGQSPFAKGVSAYLNGDYGSTKSVSPYLSALLYAGDRFCARADLVGACQSEDVVICDRYVDSNVAHQAAKLPGDDFQREEFIRWIEEIEYGSYALPRPDLTILLAVPTQVAVELIARKAARSYTSLAADIHEADRAYLDECAGVYASLAVRDPERTHVAQSMSGGELRAPESIAAEIWDVVSRRLRR